MSKFIQPHSLISGLAHRLLIFQGIRDFRYATILSVSPGVCRLATFTGNQLASCLWFETLPPPVWDFHPMNEKIYLFDWTFNINLHF
jgi:hypothetical protein